MFFLLLRISLFSIRSFVLGNAVEDLHALVDLFLPEQGAGEKAFHFGVRGVGLQDRAVYVLRFAVFSLLAEAPGLIEEFGLIRQLLGVERIRATGDGRSSFIYRRRGAVGRRRLVQISR